MAKSAQHFRLNRLVSVIQSTLGNPWNYACTAVACLPAVALAGPSGEQVVAGTAAVTRPNAVTTNIQQGTDKAIINWQSFSIGGQEYVQFTQPSPTAIALNRVVGGDPSEILGQLSANGRIFLVNPHGVYFGPGAQVDVNGLVASVLDINNDNFMAGNYVFARTADNPDGAGVVNDGTIKTGDGGFVVLAGGKVDNSGLIEARMGTIALASGNRLTLTVGDTGLVDVAVDEKAVDAAAGVNNAGQLIADGGRVLMTAKVAQGLVTTAVNNEGLVQARSIQEHDGVITLSAAGGDIENHGTIDASGQDGQAGGEVQVTGDKNITLAEGSAIHADGDGDANGGTIRVVADGKLAVRTDALISAEAGSAKGNGGFIELSGHESLGIRGMVALGKGGKLLLDPSILNIVGGGNTSAGYGSIGEVFIEGQLNSGVNLTLSASDQIRTSGTFSGVGIDATSGSGNLTLDVTNSTATGINLGGIGINIRGNILIQTQAGTISTGDLKSSTGYVHVYHYGATGTINVGNVSANNGAVIGYSNSSAAVDVTTKDVIAGNSIVVYGNHIQINGIMRASAAGNSIGGVVYLSAGTAVRTGTGGRVEGGIIQVDGFEGMPGPIDVNIATRSPQIMLGSTSAFSSSGLKQMNVHIDNTAYHGAAMVTFNQFANSYASRLSFGTIGLNFGGNASVASNLNPMVVNGFFASTTSGTLTLDNLNLRALWPDGIGLKSAGNIDLRASMLSAPQLMIDANGTITGSSANLNGTTEVDMHAGGNISIGTVAGGYVDLKSTGGGVSANTVSAGAFEVRGHGDVSLGSVTVRSGALPGTADTVLLDLMQGAGLPLPTSASGNALFRSDGNISISSLTLTDPYPYVAFILNGMLTLDSLNLSGSEILAQFGASDPTLSIGVEALAATLQDVNFNKADHFSKFPGTTIAIGVGLGGSEQMTQQGDIVIGTNGPINLGTKNFICLSAGQCIGLDNVLTSGRVLSLADASLFNIPLPQEFNNTQGDKKDKDLYTEGEGEGEGEGQSLVSHDSGSEKMCQ